MAAREMTVSMAKGDDRLSGDRGDDYIDGGEGNDTASFSGSISNYTITKEGDGFRVTDKRGDADGSDYVTNVENFSFAGQSFSAGDVVQAAMPKPVVVPAAVAPAVVEMPKPALPVSVAPPVVVAAPEVKPQAAAAPVVVPATASAGMLLTQPGSDQDLFGPEVPDFGHDGKLDLGTDFLPQGAMLEYLMTADRDDLIFDIDPESETPAAGGNTAAMNGSGSSSGGGTVGTIITGGNGTTTTGGDPGLVSGGSGSNSITGGAGNDTIATGGKPAKEGGKLILEDTPSGSVVAEGTVTGKFSPMAEVTTASSGLSEGVNSAGAFGNDLALASKPGGKGPIETAFDNMKDGKGTTVIAMRINDKENPQNSPVFSLVLSAAHLKKGDYEGALRNATLSASVPMPMYKNPMKFKVELSTGKVEADLAGENPISAYGGKKGDVPTALILKSVPKKNYVVTSDTDKLSQPAASAVLVATPGTKNLEELISNIVGNVMINDFSQSAHPVKNSAILVLSKYFKTGTVYDKTMYIGPGLDQNITTDKNGIYLGKSNITKEVANLASSNAGNNNPRLAYKPLAERVVNSLNSIQGKVVPDVDNKVFSLSINTQLTNLLSTDFTYYLDTAMAHSVRDWVGAGASSILDNKVDAFALANLAKNVQDDLDNKPQVRLNATHIYKWKDPRLEIANIFIKTFYSVGRHGNQLTLKGATPDQLARFYGATSQDQWMLRDLGAFGTLTIDNIPALMKNAESKLGKPEFDARKRAFTQEVVRKGYGNVTFGDPKMADAMKLARQSLPQIGANNDAKKVADYFNRKDLRDNLNFASGSVAINNPAQPNSTPLVSNGELEEKLIGAKDSFIQISPPKKLLSESELANFSTNLHTRNFAFMLNSLVAAPLSHREMYYVYGPGKGGPMPKDISDLRTKRQVIVDRLNASPKRFEDTVNALNQRIRLEPSFGTLLYAFMVTQGININKVNEHSKFVSVLDVATQDMDEAEALKVLSKFPPLSAAVNVVKAKDTISNEIWNYLERTAPITIAPRRAYDKISAETKAKVIGSLSQHDFEPGINAEAKTPHLLYNPGPFPKNSTDYYKDLINGGGIYEGNVGDGSEVAANPETGPEPEVDPTDLALAADPELGSGPAQDSTTRAPPITDPETSSDPGVVTTGNTPQMNTVPETYSNDVQAQYFDRDFLKQYNPELWASLQPKTYDKVTDGKG
jgi:hypothetical protein